MKIVVTLAIALMFFTTQIANARVVCPNSGVTQSIPLGSDTPVSNPLQNLPSCSSGTGWNASVLCPTTASSENVPLIPGYHSREQVGAVPEASLVPLVPPVTGDPEIPAVPMPCDNMCHCDALQLFPENGLLEWHDIFSEGVFEGGDSSGETCGADFLAACGELVNSLVPPPIAYTTMYPGDLDNCNLVVGDDCPFGGTEDCETVQQNANCPGAFNPSDGPVFDYLSEGCKNPCPSGYITDGASFFDGLCINPSYVPTCEAIVSAYHVLGSTGPVVSPALIARKCRVSGTIALGNVTSFVRPVVGGRIFNSDDVAIAATNQPTTQTLMTDAIPNIGARGNPISAVGLLNVAIQYNSGQSPCYKTATVQFSSIPICFGKDKARKCFQNLISAKMDTPSTAAHGDSGSLVLTINGNHPLGMAIVACCEANGISNLSTLYIVPLQTVVNDMHLTNFGQFTTLDQVQDVEADDRATIVKDEAETNAVIGNHPEILKIKHVISMSATFTLDKHKRYSGPEIAVIVDKKENIEEVKKALPKKLDGVPIVVRPLDIPAVDL
jgi:hypothetical protein